MFEMTGIQGTAGASPLPLHKLYLLYHELRPVRSNYSYVLETAEFEGADVFAAIREEPGKRQRQDDGTGVCRMHAAGGR